jgi:hypothetical protein
MRNRYQSRHRQKGMLMFELIVVLAVAAVALSMFMKREKLDIDQVRSKADGLMVAQVNNAIRKRIADEGSSMVAGTYTGVDWLHATSCPNGLASKIYLPCHVSGSFHYDLTPETTVTNTSGDVSASTNFGIIKTGTKTRIDLANIAVLAANNENIHGETPIAGTFYSYQVNATGELIATSSYDTGLDQWLRTDGTNSMKATLDLGNNQVKNLGAAIVGAACNGTGLIAQQGGSILSCISGKWKKQGSDFWRDPVTNFASLPAGDPIGTTRLTKNTGRAFRWSGSTWTALAVDQNGNMTVPGKLTTGVARLTNNVTIGSGCTTKEVGTTSTGDILSCVYGVWKKSGGDLNCVTKALSGGNYHGRTLSCDAGYTMTGGGCGWRSDGNNGFIYSFPNGNGWYCADYDYAHVNIIRVRCCQ